MAEKEKELTKKRLLFVDKYFETKFNGIEAYLQTYPRVKKRETAKAAASRLLTNVNVKEEVERRKREMVRLWRHREMY
ncbi:MAG: terminase small subunit [Deltaproteobacteria bacterium]|nr:terminase small subunit [Deltaproteobacteria bacterium]MBN2844518.1 terminase small subunit [Deltaproteobacteria bacterium]